MTGPRILDMTDRDSESYQQHVSEAVQVIGDGRLIVLPTDTVYGIGADAFDAYAVNALLAAKDRGREFPVPVLVGRPSVLHGLVTIAPDSAVALTERFWPGPLTVIVRHSTSLAWDLGDSDGTVAVRMPDDPVALDVLVQTGPMAVSSANRHGRPAAQTVQDALHQLGERVELYLDGGPTTGGVASTIVDCTQDRPQVVRRGALSIEQLREVVDTLQVHDSTA